MMAGGRTTHGTAKVALGRAVLFFAFWLMIAGYDPADLLIGLATAALATWASLRLLPPARVRLRPGVLAWFILHFLGQSVRSGMQVAWLAFRPSMPIRPGVIPYRTNLSGSTLSAFCAISSLLPGTLPMGGDAQDELLIHCLDVGQPVAADLAREELLFSQVLEGLPSHD
ncbi:MAG TPA: Na+/H+ antiporter subunit E [Reyranella sp.]|nr:Na+/H+ antiporter subunit E [Reyranella sp.]